MTDLDDDQYRFLYERIDHLEGRLDDLAETLRVMRDDLMARRSHVWEVAIGVMVAVEAVIGVLLYMHS